MAGKQQLEKLKIFISYSRVDEAFADELKLGLEDKGYAVEVDKHSIRQGEEWKQRLTKLIAGCDTVVFVLSPDSARSTVCHWEVEEAHARAKRILPVLYRDLDEQPRGHQPNGQPWPEGPATAPERLALINYPQFADGRAFMSGLRGLVQALEDDLEWIEEHSRLASRARDWEDGGRPINRLMSGPDIASAKRLVEVRKPTAPEMLPLQLDFIQASEVHDAAQTSEREKELVDRRRLAEQALAQSQKLVQRTKIGLFALAILTAAAAALGVWAEMNRRTALLAKNEADQARAVAERRADRLKLSMLEALTEPAAVQEAIDFMIAQEIGSTADYTSKFSRPRWPGAASGVTIGVGYDLGYNTEKQFEADWSSVLPYEAMARLKPVIGKRGVSASELVDSLKDVEVPLAAARQVFSETTVPRYYNLVTLTFPGASELPFACQGALLSLVFNRGGSLEGDRRAEMLAIRDAIGANKIDEIASSIRQMRRLWPDMPGLVARRDGEAMMCEKAIRLREKVLQALATDKK